MCVCDDGVARCGSCTLGVDCDGICEDICPPPPFQLVTPGPQFGNLGTISCSA